jgi:YHS domain-containing protein
MTVPRHRNGDFSAAAGYSRRDFLSDTGAAIAGATIVTPGLVPVTAAASAKPAPGQARLLPAPSKEGGIPLMQALSLRRSTREFSSRKLSDQVLSDLLWAAYGVNRASGDRTAPSWRHVIVIDIYAAMEDGLWLYDPQRHALIAHPTGDIRAQTGRQDFPANAPLNLVYVAHGDGYFEPRQVETGWRFGERVQVTAGLMDGEPIVVSGNFLIDSESRMKAAVPAPPAGIAKDVICGMDVEEKTARAKGLVSEYEGRTYYFCAEMCKREFDAAPGKHATR